MLALDSDGNLIIEPLPDPHWEHAVAFCQWLREQATRDDSVGDLASDFISIAPRPGYANLVSRVACGCAGAQEGLEEALSEYRGVAGLPSP